jgi:hypothetical protein
MSLLRSYAHPSSTYRVGMNKPYVDEIRAGQNIGNIEKRDAQFQEKRPHKAAFGDQGDSRFLAHHVGDRAAIRVG